MGIYPLLQDDNCHLLSEEFDEAKQRKDTRVFVNS
jgi:hypothetical protein